MPLLIAATLREHGVTDDQISIIPDEQAAIDAGLRMAQAGDVLLVFADALVRSWKQVIKFKPEGAPQKVAVVVANAADEQDAVEPRFSPEQWEGVSRDDRGIFISRESDD